MFIIAKEKPNIRFTAIIFKHTSGVHTLEVRHRFSRPEDIEKISKEIVENGKFQFSGEVIFLDRLKAIIKLKEVGLIR